MTLDEAVRSGDRRLALEAIRDHLAAELTEAPPASVAPIAKQLAEVMRELAALPAAEEASPVDQLARRRAKRRADTDPSQRAAGSEFGGAGGS